MDIIFAKNAPAAIGPYCHAVVHGEMVFCSGQIPLDPKTMELIGSTIEEQTTQVIKNIETVLTQIGSGLDKVIKTIVFLKSMDDFNGMNQIYENLFNGHTPARSTVEVAALPKNARIEIECIAAIK